MTIYARKVWFENGTLMTQEIPPADFYKREWKSLTDEECIAAIDEDFNFALDHGNVSDRSVIRYARAIEAKLREKNT